MSNETTNVIPLQRPFPLPAQIPFGTPSPEDAIIEIIDNGASDEEV